jgi:hypothetical protein
MRSSRLALSRRISSIISTRNVMSCCAPWMATALPVVGSSTASPTERSQTCRPVAVTSSASMS